MFASPPVEAEDEVEPDQGALAMKPPRLIVTVTRNGVPVEAVCSNCLDVTFHVGCTQPTLEAHLDAMKALFEAHVEKVHSIPFLATS